MDFVILSKSAQIAWVHFLRHSSTKSIFCCSIGTHYYTSPLHHQIPCYYFSLDRWSRLSQFFFCKPGVVVKGFQMILFSWHDELFVWHLEMGKYLWLKGYTLILSVREVSGHTCSGSPSFLVKLGFSASKSVLLEGTNIQPGDISLLSDDIPVFANALIAFSMVADLV